MFRYPLLAAILAAMTSAASASNYYVVAPIPGKMALASAISLALTPGSLPDGKAGSVYSLDLKPLLQVTGDPAYTGFGVRWTLSAGKLAAGLVLNPDTGAIAGTPSESGTFAFTAQTLYKSKSASQAYSMVIQSLGDIVKAGPYRAWADGSYAASCKAYRLPTGKTYSGDVGDGIYRIQLAGLVQDVYCDMTTDGGGWTMWYTTNAAYHIATAGPTAIAYGTNGYSQNLRNLPFREVLYVQHSTGNKDWFKRDTAADIRVADYVGAGNVLNVGGGVTGTWTGKGGADTRYKYELAIGDYTWMQVGLMMSGHIDTCWKLPGSWCSDTTTNFYRIYGEGNGVTNNGQYGGVAFHQNGHLNVAYQLISVGVR